MQDHLNKIFNVLKNYENFEPYMLNPDKSINDDLLRNHILLWISQFEESEKIFMADTVAKLLENRFITKALEVEFIENLFKNQYIVKENTMPFPLRIQRNGNSQKRLVEYYESFAKSLNISYSQDSVIYLDDFIFSGGRVLQDLSNWIPLQRNSYKIYVVVLGYHTNIWRIETQLKDKIYSHNQIYGTNISLTILRCIELENRLFKKNESCVLWPMASFFQDENYKLYIDPNFIYRDGFIATPQNFFTNNEDRVRFENICLKYGFKIIQRCYNTNKTTKPLGNSKFGYGFGGLIFNYRNCPNNSPLIFWWGSSNPSQYTLYNQWRPLMPRTVY